MSRERKRPQSSERPSEERPTLRRVSMEEANTFLAVKAKTAGWIAFGVFLCILSPICLIMLGGYSEIPGSGISEGLAAAIGLTVLLAMVAAAVAIFVYSGGRTSALNIWTASPLRRSTGSAAW